MTTYLPQPSATPSAGTATALPMRHLPIQPPGRRGSAALARATQTWLLGLATIVAGGATWASTSTVVIGVDSAVADTVQLAEQAYAGGDNLLAGRLGLQALAQQPGNAALRLKVGNALAWSGQMRLATSTYAGLDGTPLALEGLLGRANVQLWSGRPERAVAMYEQVLATRPDLAEAREGLAKARLALRPLTRWQLGAQQDSDDSRRRSGSISHQWWSQGLDQRFELAVESGQEERRADVADLRPRELSFAWEPSAWPMRPRLKLTAQQSPHTQVFWDLGLRNEDSSLRVDVGRINWGKQAFNPRAWRDDLSAWRLQVAGELEGSAGRISGNLMRMRVSDGNDIDEFGIQYTPSWQPLPYASGVKVFTGLFGRHAQREDSRYWSPAQGHYIGFVGAGWGRWEGTWEAWGEVKRSLLIDGEGTGGWSLSLGGKRWLALDWALRGEAFLLDSGRSGKAYRARSLTMALEHRW